jgi:ribosome recycling factor
MDDAKKMEKAGQTTQDQLHDTEAEIQKLTDRFVKSIDEHLERKDAEVMKV